jgi:hypothetical protein
LSSGGDADNLVRFAENVQVLGKKRAKLIDFGFGMCFPYQVKLISRSSHGKHWKLCTIWYKLSLPAVLVSLFLSSSVFLMPLSSGA